MNQFWLFLIKKHCIYSQINNELNELILKIVPKNLEKNIVISKV